MAGAETEIGRADQFDLAHRHAAGQLIEIFAEGRPQHQLFELAQGAAFLQPLGPAQTLGQPFDRGGVPGQAVRGQLLGLEPVGLDLGGHRDFRLVEQGAGGGQRLLAVRQQGFA